MSRHIASILQVAAAANRALTTAEVARETGLSRQAIAKHLQRLVDEGRLRVEGKGRATRYWVNAVRLLFEARLPILGLAEDRVWNEARKVLPPSLSPNVLALTAYAFTEMVNNAIDHANSESVEVRMFRSNEHLGFEIIDDGVGLFENIRQSLNLPDHLTALQEVSKGKLTTQPARHTGEGLFFTSKVADVFEACANGLRWTVDNIRQDVGVGTCSTQLGTHITFKVREDKAETLESIFSRYTHDYAFDTTRTVVKLFAYGVSFVSRSEAKRLLHGLEKFSFVILDFSHVESVGQGFADEVFRIWATDHPNIQVSAENMNAAVAFMVNRARAR